VGDFTHIAMARQSPTGVGSHNKTIAHGVGSHKGKVIAHGVGSHNKPIAHRVGSHNKPIAHGVGSHKGNEGNRLRWRGLHGAKFFADDLANQAGQ
jgi:hypothetical protein